MLPVVLVFFRFAGAWAVAGGNDELAVHAGTDTSAHLVDRVLPRVPVHQWVLSLPYGLRYRLASERELTADDLRIFVGAGSPGSGTNDSS
jgi:hypothetical protein